MNNIVNTKLCPLSPLALALLLVLAGMMACQSPTQEQFPAPTIETATATNSESAIGSTASQDATNHSTSVSTAKQATVGADTRSQPEEHPLDAVIAYAKDLREKLRMNVQTYTANMTKQERVGGKLTDPVTMFLKIREREEATSTPLSAYIKFLAPPSTSGREVIWIEGKNDNNLIAHETGMLNLKRLNLPPEGRLAMMGSKYPITKIGLKNLVDQLVEKAERDRLLGDCNVRTEEGIQVGGRVCKLIEVMHTERDPKFEFYIARVYVDEERAIPLKYSAYLWPAKPTDPPQLEEEYLYENVVLNPGLTDIDFDPANKEYNFPSF